MASVAQVYPVFQQFKDAITRGDHQQASTILAQLKVGF